MPLVHKLAKRTLILCGVLSCAACGSDDDDVVVDLDGGPPFDEEGPEIVDDSDLIEVTQNLDKAIPTLNGCKASQYKDLSGSSSKRVIGIAVKGLTFTPKCITIAKGQTVRWEGSLSTHPLAPGNADNGEAGSPNNPIELTSSGQSVEFTFPNSGTFPYYCTVHGFGNGKGMSASINVK